MKKTIKKIATGTLVVVVTFISGVITLVLYPQPLFANQLEYKNFKVYSNHEVGTDITRILDNANALVAASELNDSSYTYDLFLCYNTFYNRFDDKLLGSDVSARAIDNNVVVKVKIDPKRNLAFPSFPEHCEIALARLIAHEMLHCLQANRYGRLRFNPAVPDFLSIWGFEEVQRYELRDIYK